MRLRHAILAPIVAVMLGAAATPLTEATVRAFVARQDRAWAKRDLDGYFATFAPDAVFVDQARTRKGEVIRYGASSVAEARAQSRRFLAGADFTESAVVERVLVAPDRRSARVLGRKTTVIVSKARGRRTHCAETEQTVVATASGLRSRGQVETAVRCAGR